MLNVKMEAGKIDCPVREGISETCSCPKTDCERHGLCCACIVYHKSREDAALIKRFPHCLRGLVKAAVEG